MSLSSRFRETLPQKTRQRAIEEDPDTDLQMPVQSPTHTQARAHTCYRQRICDHEEGMIRTHSYSMINVANLRWQINKLRVKSRKQITLKPA